MRRDIFVSVVVPLDNDKDILPGVVRDIDAVMKANFGDYELIFIDDGSSDGTRSFFESVKSDIASFRYFRLTRPFGMEVAIACGLEQAIGDVIVVLNPACDPPERIPYFAEKANDSDGIVIGIALHKSRRPWLYRAAYNLYFGVCRIFLARTQVYGATHFMALTRTALNALLRIKDSFRYIRVLAMYAGFEVTKVPYEFMLRREPPRHRKLFPLLGTIGHMIVSNSDRPLRIAAIASALIGVGDFAFLVYVVAARFLYSGVQPGWASTNFFNAIMFGVMFLVLAVLCEYMAEMRSEVKKRPLYVVQGELQSNVMLVSADTRNVVSHEDRVELSGVIRSHPQR
ncbi:MAG: polyisoprenyl-phosphate glycosyltransferase [Alphaproteobacteria bacterium]|nr:polyisoprenyl-phosphate glycosyltransferase [Alphaproteobacteria bacterium]